MITSALKKWTIVPIMGLVWIFALLYGSGIGQAYDIYGRAKVVVVLVVILHLIVSGKLRRIPLQNFLLFAYLLVVTLITSFIYGKNMLDYLWLYGIVYLISLLPVAKEPMRMVSILYGVLGMAVLYVWNYGSAFSGWNTNSLAMIAFFSFALLIVSFNKTSKISITLLLAAYAVLYFLWTENLESRSGTLFAIIMILGVYHVLPFNRWLKKPLICWIILLAPLIIAILVVLIQNQAFVANINTWSLVTFGKPLFNGRDEIWHQGFMQWLQHPIIGNGNLSAANWHNSAITMLVGGGTAGYLIWIFLTRKILNSSSNHFHDSIVYGLQLGFLCIWVQQSVELGLIASQANAIPYAMLGLLIGRVRTLEKENGT